MQALNFLKMVKLPNIIGTPKRVAVLRENIHQVIDATTRHLSVNHDRETIGIHMRRLVTMNSAVEIEPEVMTTTQRRP